MTQPFFKPEITAEKTSDAESGPRRSQQYLVDDVSVQKPCAQAAAMMSEPFSNDTPAPSGQTMREPPTDPVPKRPTLHLPGRLRGERACIGSVNASGL